MRYITRELYEQIQFTSWIEFELSPKKNFNCYNRNDIETILKNEIEQRLQAILSLPNEVKKLYKYTNIEKDYKEYINGRVKLLKKYLPDYIKEDIYDYRLLVMNLLSKDLYKKLLKWKSEIELNWKNACNEYNKQYRITKQHLSNSMKKFSSGSMHEQKIISIHKLSKDKLSIEYKNGMWGKANLNFEGVKSIETEGDIEGSSWLHDEVYLFEKDDFEYRVLLDNGEMRIVAKDLYISFVNSDYINKALKLESYNDSFNVILETIRDKEIAIGKENLLEEEKKLLLIDNLICMLKYDSITPKNEIICSGFEQFIAINFKDVTETLAILESIGESNISAMLTKAMNIYNSGKEKSIKSRELKKIDKTFLDYENYHNNELYKLFVDYIKEKMNKCK